MAKGSFVSNGQAPGIGPRPRSSRVRKLLRKLHLIVGAITGPIVLIVCLTGSLWVFRSEIKELFGSDRSVEAQERSMMGPLEAKKAGKVLYPDRRVHGVVYGDQEKPLELIFHEEDPEFYRSLYLNPYDGKVIGREDHTTGFFNVVLDGHMSLWLPDDIGEPLVSWAVLIFLLSLLSGLILWWPRSNKERPKRFRLNLLHWRNRTQKRFDLHAVAGLYASAFVLIFAITGLSMGFSWFKEALHDGLGGDGPASFRIPDAGAKGDTDTEQGKAAIEELPQLLRSRYPEAESFEIHYPKKEEQAIYVELSENEGLYYNNDHRFFHPRTLEELEAASIFRPYEQTSLPGRIVRMDYDIHVGAILGLPGKILAFLSSLTIGSLPITGAMLWWTRRKKSKKARSRKARKIHERDRQKRKPLARA